MPEQYGRVSLYDFNLMVESYIENTEAIDKKQWYHTRSICWLIYRANADKTATKDIEKWWPLDTKVQTKAQVAKENKKLQADIDKALAKINNNGRR